MNLEFSHYLMFCLGALITALGISPKFRTSFFKGLRKFIGNANKGAKELNQQYSSRKQEKPLEQPNVKHEYKYEHKGKKCEICNGTGSVVEKPSKIVDGAIGYHAQSIDCPNCKGTGVEWD